MNAIIVNVSGSDRLIEAMTGELAERNISLVRSRPGNATIHEVDRKMPDLVIVETDGASHTRMLDCIVCIKNRCPALPVFLLARNSSEELAIGALKAGVDDYFKPPFAVEDLLASIDKRLLSNPNHVENAVCPAGISERMVGSSRIMIDLKKLLSRVARVDSTVLITGETGTGKELAATLIHENSHRTGNPLVIVNCAALPDSLVESELFGYERGAFTGAVVASPGRFEQAQDGTMFLDEIGDMTRFAQAKILKVVEDKQVLHLGGVNPVELDFRLIAATNREADRLIEEGSFREDLFYRLNVARVHMPSLREHPEDIPELTEYGIGWLNRKLKRNIQGLQTDVARLFGQYDWPGNVRQLLNVLEAAFINMPRMKIGFSDLPVYFKRDLSESGNAPSNERSRIIAALSETNWNKSTAAKKLKWSRMTLYRKMAKYRIAQG